MKTVPLLSASSTTWSAQCGWKKSLRGAPPGAVPTTGPRGSARDGVGSSGQDCLVPAAARSGRGSGRAGGGIDLLGLGPDEAARSTACGGAEVGVGVAGVLGRRAGRRRRLRSASSSVWGGGGGVAWMGTAAAVWSPLAVMRERE